MSRTYSVGWGDEWPQLDVTVPDGSELALFDATYEPHVETGPFPPIRTARTLRIKLVFIDLEEDQVRIAHDMARHPAGRAFEIVKEDKS